MFWLWRKFEEAYAEAMQYISAFGFATGSKLFLEKRRGAGVVEYLVGLMVVIIIAVAVAIPVINDTISNANLSGTAGTILSYVPLMIVIGVFMMAVALIRGRL